MITTVMRAGMPLGCVTVDAAGWLTADLTMLAGDDGSPLMAGSKICPDGNGGIRQGTFRFLVTGMRVAGTPPHDGALYRCETCHGPLALAASCQECGQGTALRCPSCYPGARAEPEGTHRVPDLQ
jgi:hypothetical protein